MRDDAWQRAGVGRREGRRELLYGGRDGPHDKQVIRPVERPAQDGKADRVSEEARAAPPEWVVWSSRESIDSDVRSATAIIETLLAVPLYWVIAIYFQTYFLLLTSIVVAPLVLLRSDESVALGVRWFLAWKGDIREFKDLAVWERVLICLVWALTVGAAFAFALFASQRYMVGPGPWGAFWYGVPLAWAAVGIVSMALGVTGILPDVEEKVLAAAGVLAAVAGVAGGAGTGASFITISELFSIVAALRLVGLTTTAALELAMIVPIVVGAAIGVFAVSVAIRVAATLRHFHAGVRRLPRNFCRLTLCTSPLQTPELIPGLTTDNDLMTLVGVIKFFRENRLSDDLFARLFAFTMLPIIAAVWFLPAWFYRITLKSTAWFWWPLAYLGDAPSPRWHPVLYHRQTLHSLKGWVTIVLAIATIAGFAFTNIVRSGVIFEANPLLSPIGYLFLINRTISPAQGLSLALAGLSLWIVFRLDAANIDAQVGRDNDRPDLIAAADRKFRWTERLGRLRLVLTVLFQLIVASQAVLYFNSRTCWFQVPAGIAQHARWLYADKMPEPDCR